MTLVMPINFFFFVFLFSKNQFYSTKKGFQMKISKYLLPFIAVVALTTSCSKEYVIPEPVEVVDPNAPIDSTYFSTDILPIFTAGSPQCVACHSGGTSPDLTAANAYAALTFIPGQYIDVANPSSSVLYTKINTGGTMNGYMPSQGDIAKVLKWIEEGALDN